MICKDFGIDEQEVYRALNWEHKVAGRLPERTPGDPLYRHPIPIEKLGNTDGYSDDD